MGLDTDSRSEPTISGDSRNGKSVFIVFLKKYMSLKNNEQFEKERKKWTM